jgi:Ni/Co efflux regulator RcnB
MRSWWPSSSPCSRVGGASSGIPPPGPGDHDRAAHGHPDPGPAALRAMRGLRKHECARLRCDGITSRAAPEDLGRGLLLEAVAASVAAGDVAGTATLVGAFAAHRGTPRRAGLADRRLLRPLDHRDPGAHHRVGRPASRPRRSATHLPRRAPSALRQHGCCLGESRHTDRADRRASAPTRGRGAGEPRPAAATEAAARSEVPADRLSGSQCLVAQASAGSVAR